MEPRLRAERLRVGYDDRVVIPALDLSIPEGKITVIVGANACGKSTLLRTLARLLKPLGGTVLLDGESIGTIPTKDVAKRLGILPQSPVAPDGLTVTDLVARGRFPHQTWFDRWTEEDEVAVDASMLATGVQTLRDRQVDELSGGQRQRAWIAMALAQDTAIMLLDEPTTYLDIAHQVEVLDLLEELNDRDGRTIVMVLHDLNQAARYAHHMVAMRDGEIYAEGAPSDIVTEAFVLDVFSLPCRVVVDPEAGSPLCLPLRRPTRLGHEAVRPGEA